MGGASSHHFAPQLAHDDQLLFSCATDGTVFALSVQILDSSDGTGGASTLASGAAGASASGASMLHQMQPGSWGTGAQFNLDAVLVSGAEAEEKALALREARKGNDDLRNDMEYSLHKKDSEWGEALRRQKEENEAALLAERKRFEELQSRYEAYVREHLEETERRDGDYVQVTQELENQYEHKLVRAAFVDKAK